MKFELCYVINDFYPCLYVTFYFYLFAIDCALHINHFHRSFATLPFMGVNRYGYPLGCDFYWSDTSAAGRFFVVIFRLQGKGNDLHLKDAFAWYVHNDNSPLLRFAPYVEVGMIAL